MTPLELAPGLLHIPGYLDRAGQLSLLHAVHEVIAASPLFTPRMPRTGKPFSVRMTNCGELGWVSDERGYRYQPSHPETGAPWAPFPDLALRAWRDLADHPDPPQACLVNVYDAKARMGLHQDRDEEDFGAPVVSLSLGRTGLFRFGSAERKAPTRSIRLRSGDALVLGGPSRLAFHGIDRLVDEGGGLPAGDALVPDGGRYNLTLRRVTRPV